MKENEYIIDPNHTSSINLMFKNYLKIAWRNLLRSKVFSFINIFGLAVGLTTCLLIMLYIFDEHSYDNDQKDGDRLFRITSINNKGETWAAAAGPLAEAVKKSLPEVEQSARLMTFPDIAKMLLKYENGKDKKQFFEPNGYYVDSTFFKILSYDFKYGNAEALNEPNTLAISDQLSHKFFANANPVGKSIVVNTPFGEFSYTVKAVFDGSRHKSHIPASYFLSMHNKDMWNWVQQQTRFVGNNVFFTYLKLKPSADPKATAQKVQALFEREGRADMKAMGFSQKLFLQPVKDIYLRSSLGNELAANGNIKYLYILGSIAAIILIIACINFMNLSTARSEKRSKEVGVRKVMGAEKSSLIWQFLGESFMLCVIALFVALILTELLLPYFNQLTQKNIHLFNYASLLYWITGLTLLTGLLAGLYPAFYLSAFKPVSVLKGKIANSIAAVALRKGLVVFQFSISVCLVFAAIVIGAQLNFLKNREMGFNKGRKLILPLQEGFLNSESNYMALKNEFSKYPGIQSVSSGSSYPGIDNLNDMLFFSEGKLKTDNVDVHLAAIENGFIETLGFQLLSGRAFSKEFTADSAGIILNETAVKQLGYTASNAVGRKIQYDVGPYKGSMNIVGVVKDFNFESLHKKIEPHGFTTAVFGNKYGFMVISLTTDNYAGILKNIQSSWTKLYPSTPFVYSFMDQDFQRNYEKEQLTSGIVVDFTIIAIVIACLGLFGLAAFSAEQRTKEIGIRKVLGASVANITTRLSGDFIKLVCIAIVIALPIGWLAMNKWLQDFAYKVPMRWWFFVAAALLAVLIALLTISFQTIKSALANPVESLKTE